LEKTIMTNTRWIFLLLFAVFLFGCTTNPNTQQKAADSITAEELEVHLDFLASDEFKGRNTPSPELKITSRYIATEVESYGLEPLMPDGSYFQNIPLEVRTIDPTQSSIRLISNKSRQSFAHAYDFGITDRRFEEAQLSGGIVFAGLGLEAPEQGWDDFSDVDIKGKIVVMLNAELPKSHPLSAPEHGRLYRRRSLRTGQKGAAAVLNVISEERERDFEEKGYLFDTSGRVRLVQDLKASWRSSRIPYSMRADIRHSMASEILGISPAELKEMFSAIKRGEQVPARALKGKRLEITVAVETQKNYSSNVVAFLEGTDEELKAEYILFGSHHDHIGAREGKVYNGADDNGSGTVAMLEIAQALAIARPKRSTILVWHTAEEKGLWGSRYFVEHSPIPVEKMSAELNMDMLCRNDPNSIYLIGSKILSSELDAAIHRVNDAHIQMNLDYKYEDPKHPERFFFRSDQYPYIQYGVPAVWFFCGTTEDYHQETDTVDKVDFEKMEKVTRLVYLTAMELGNTGEMLKLDTHPEITSRGEHNLKVKWR
jgi:hypothetical protein